MRRHVQIASRGGRFRRSTIGDRTPLAAILVKRRTQRQGDSCIRSALVDSGTSACAETERCVLMMSAYRRRALSGDRAIEPPRALRAIGASRAPLLPWPPDADPP